MLTAFRVLRTATILGLAASYLLHLFWWPDGRVPSSSQDCSKYSRGAGLDQHGQLFKSFDEFFPYYLCEHQQPRTKLFHFLATFNELALLASMLFAKQGLSLATLALILIQGYGLAWYSHFTIENNKPATWQYPVYSYLADHQLFLQTLMGQHVLWI